MSDGRGSSSFEEAHFHRRAEATPITNYDGFSNLKAYLKEQKAQGCENVPRLMLKYSKVDAPTQPATADMFPPKANEDRQFPHNEITGVSFVYENVPLPGWRKELVLRIVGNSAGRIEVYYANPTREKRFRSRQELQTYLEAEIMKTNPNNTNPNNVSLIINSTLNNFDFKPVFCVCQCSEDPFRNYIECSYGKIGCSKWIHPECVGLGSRSKTELDSFPKVICPFCTIYLRGCGYDSFVPKNRIKLLDKFSTRFELHDTYLEPDNELIEETNCPHRIWGLDDFTLTYYHESEIVGDAVKGGGKGLSSSLPQTAYHADYDKKSSKTAANTTSSSNNNTSNQVLLYHSDQHISKWRRKIYDETKEKMIMVGVVGGYAVTEDDQPDNQIMRTRIKQRILEKQRQSQETERKRLFTATGSHYHSINSVIGLKRGANTSSLSFNENNSYYYPPPAPPIIHYKTNLDDLICRSFLNYQLNKKRNFIANQHLFNIAPIAYHNQEDGGIRIITTVTSTRSLHDLCKNGLCGLCLQPLLLPSMTTTTTTSAVTSGNGRGKKNKTTTDEGNSNGDAALTVPLTEICNFGAVSYELHRHCAFLLNHEGELLHSIMKQFPHLSTQPSPSSASSLNKQEEGERRQKEEDQGDDSQEKKEDNCTEQTEVAKEEDEEEVNKENDNDHQGCCDEYGCKINRYYYDDIDDAKCDDCQKPGAVLLTWDTSKASYNLHLLCLFHLIRRKWLLNRQKNFIALEEEESEKHVITEENKDTVMEVEEVQKEVMSDERVKDEEEEKNESKQVDESSAMEIADNDEASSQIKEKEPNETITIIDDVPEKQEETEREGEREEQENSLKVESVSTNIEVIDLIDSPSTEKVKIEDPETTEGKIPEEDDQNAVLNQSASMETKQTSHISQNHAQISNHYATPSNLPSSSSFVEDFSVLHCRCMICGSHDGRIIRCCGANCHIRAHLICASYTKEWKIITLHNPSIISKNKKNHAKDMAVVKAIGFVCSTHRIFDSTVEDEEEIDYFKK